MANHRGQSGLKAPSRGISAAPKAPLAPPPAKNFFPPHKNQFARSLVEIGKGQARLPGLIIRERRSPPKTVRETAVAVVGHQRVWGMPGNLILPVTYRSRSPSWIVKTNTKKQQSINTKTVAPTAKTWSGADDYRFLCRRRISLGAIVMKRG